ncbi:MAG: molybdenum cofactor guanylyltransferase [Saprospiraceae bacterium]|nr:molybdenum cofactor guanylyltransferase [Saprospiraceae bacterium]
MNATFDGVGIVAAGGLSRRMGTNKAMLQRHGTKWIDHAHDLLSSICGEVLISCGKDHPGDFNNYPLLIDRHPNIGPIAALDSALHRRPGCPIFLLAVDMPYVDKSLLSMISRNRNALKDATVPFTKEDDRWHPLCAIYEPSCHNTLQDQIDAGIYALWRCLSKLDVVPVFVDDGLSLLNVNTPEGLEGL